MATDSADQSTTTLHIAIGGLCLLVRDERSDGKMLHVLFPKVGHGEHHTAALMVHPDFRVPGDPNLAKPISLDGVFLTLPLHLTGQVGGEITTTTKFPSIADETCHEGRPVPRALLKDVPHGWVKAKITITAGERGSRENQGAEWDLGPCEKRPMGTWVEWVIPNLPAGDLELQCGTERVRLRPKSGVIELVFLHEMSLPEDPPLIEDLPASHGPSEPTFAHHFRAFYPLIGKPETASVPKHGNPDPMEEHEHSPKNSARANWGLDYTCIMATAPADSRP